MLLLGAFFQFLFDVCSDVVFSIDIIGIICKC